MENIEKLIFVTYCRKSSERDDRQTLSLGSQIEGLKKIIFEKSLNSIAILSEAKSAYKTGRPEFEKMIKMIEDGKANAILTWHPSRLTRNAIDSGRLVYLMDQGLLKQILTPDGITTGSTNDKFMLQIHNAMSKKSSDDTGDNIDRDFKKKLNMGEFPDYAPRGYLNIDKDGKIAGKQYIFEKQQLLELLGRKLKRIEKDPILWPLILRLFEYCALGIYSLNELRNMAFEWGIKGTRSNKKISKSEIARILSNPFNYGAIRWKGEIIEPEDLPDETRHDPIISRELFEKAQVALGNKKKPKSNTHLYPYTNFMTCGHCGGNITGLMAKGHVYYRCMKCKNQHYLREDLLEEQFDNTLSKITINDSFLKLALEEINKQNEEEILQKNQVAKQQQNALRICNSRMDNLIKLKISPDNIDGSLLSDGEFIKAKKELMEEKYILDNELTNINQNKMSWYDSCVDYVNLIHKLREKYPKLSPTKKREIFQFICYNPSLKGKNIDIPCNNPNNLLIYFQLEHQPIITANFGLPIQKNRTLDPVLSNWRGRRDSNPRPSA